MSGPAVQLTFTLRTSPNVRTVHLLGSWDSYKSQLPLSAVKESSAKPGSWKGTFRFQGSHALKLGSRYWYYYIVDGYHVSHDPAKEFVTEKTTGRKLNILDVPSDKAEAKAPKAAPAAGTKTTSASRHSREIPTGRALSPGRILHPKPSKPYASRQLREADYETSPLDDLEERFANARLSSRNYSSSPSELSDSSDSSGTVFSKSGSDSPSSASSLSDGGCQCGRFGVTREGKRVMLDCGGKRCGYGDSSSDCSTSSDEEDSADERERIMLARRQAAQKAAPAAKTSSTKASADPRKREVAVERRRR